MIAGAVLRRDIQRLGGRGKEDAGGGGSLEKSKKLRAAEACRLCMAFCRST